MKEARDPWGSVQRKEEATRRATVGGSNKAQGCFRFGTRRCILAGGSNKASCLRKQGESKEKEKEKEKEGWNATPYSGEGTLERLECARKGTKKERFLALFDCAREAPERIGAT